MSTLKLNYEFTSHLIIPERLMSYYFINWVICYFIFHFDTSGLQHSPRQRVIVT